MDVYSIDYTLYVQDGEHEPKQATNFTPVIETAYFNLDGPQDIPASLGIQLILEDGSVRSLTLPMTSNLARTIVAEEPRAVLLKTGYAPLVQKYIVDQLSKTGRPGECQRGVYLPGNGTYRLADDTKLHYPNDYRYVVMAKLLPADAVLEDTVSLTVTKNAPVKPAGE